MENLDPSTYAAVNNANFKTIAELGTLTGALMAQNAASHQKRMDIISELITTEALGGRAGIDPTEAKATATTLEAGLSQLTAQMGMVVAALQVYSKTAGNVPPVTPGDL